MKLSLVLLLVASLCLAHGEAELKAEDAPEGLDEEQLASLESEEKGFQAEVKQLMHMIIHSIYSNVEVFLRELISNASDALDKIRQASITDASQLGTKTELEVRVRADPEKRQLHIIDTGVGMTKEELERNLGTIAKSGTKEFMQKLQGADEQDASSLIGQFGVGFYSAFLVADRVTVVSKSNDDDKQWVWQSDAAQSFSIAEDPRGPTLGRGTQITLHFKEEHEDLLKEDKLRELVSRYSEFIQFPIHLWTAKNVTEEVPLSEEELEAARAEAAAKKAEKEAKESEGEEEEEEEAEADKATDEEAEEDVPTTKSVERTVYSWEHLNSQKPLWMRSPSEVTDEEYVEFYKHISKDWQEPSKWEHFKAEGAVNFKALVYLPKKPPSGFWESNPAKRGALALYVKRVFITDNWDGILPRYLAFLRGVVDCSDLDLNVSREVLQQSKSLNVIKKKIVRKVLAMIQSLQDDEEAYTAFYKDFAKTLKYGVLEDGANKVRISKLLRWRSSASDSNLTSFQEYVDRMRDDQEEIYYLAGQSLEHVQGSPLLEKLEERGIEVLYLVDALDEYVAQHLAKFDGKYKLTNVAREGLTLPGDDKEDAEDNEEDKDEEEEFSDVLDYLKEQLKDQVRKVVISRRLVGSPATLVAGSFGMTANMERILKAQTLGDEDPSLQYQPKPVMEINSKHPIIVSLKRVVDEDEHSAAAADVARLLYDSSAVASGYNIASPNEFSQRIQRVLYRSLGLKEEEQEKKEEPKEDKDDL